MQNGRNHSQTVPYSPRPAETYLSVSVTTLKKKTKKKNLLIFFSFMVNTK